MSTSRRRFLTDAAGGLLVPELLGASAARSSAETGLTDRLDIAAPGDEAAHGFSASGQTARKAVGDWIGGHDTRRLARTVRGAGSHVSYRFRVTPHAPLLAEIEEVYGREPGIVAYTVLADGRQIALRTFRGCGAGPVHHFVCLPPTPKASVTLTLRSETDTPFSIARLWAYSDFDRYFVAGGFDVPYYLAPTVHLSWSDEAADRAKLRQIRDSLGDHPYVRPAFTTWVPYAALGRAEAEERIDYVLRLAAAERLPVQLCFDTWWGSTPGGSDGQGGYWSDVPYQQVVYNATRRQYALSIPNQWSSTPWLSPGSAALNAFKARRLTLAAGHLARRLRERLAAGVESYLLAVNLDNEPVYWASGNAGLGSDLLLADFHPETVAAAKADGVILAPEKRGLGQRERLWLFRNLLAYNERIGRAAAEGLGRDAVLVSAGAAALLPADHAAANIYTQAITADGAAQYPMLETVYPAWETAAPVSVHVGGEWNADTVPVREAVLHQVALGRNAAVNAEAGNDPKKQDGVLPGYALGQRFFALYNYPLDRMDAASADLHDVTRPFPAFVYTPTLLENDFRSEGWRKAVASAENVQTDIIGNTPTIAAFPADGARSGVLTYHLTAPDGAAFDTGLLLELSGRAFVFRKQDNAVFVRVLAGDAPDPAAMTEVARFANSGGFGARDRIDLSPLARGRRMLWVRIEMHAPGLPASVLSWCSVHHVRFALPWSEARARAGFPQDESLRSVRRRNLIVSWRADAERAITDLARDAGDGDAAVAAAPMTSLLRRARAAARRGAYADAYRLASQGITLRLPVAFAVRAPGGSLGPYPIRIAAAGAPVVCLLESLRPDRARLRLEAAGQAPVAVRVTVGGLTPGGRYGIERMGAVWTVARRSAAGTTGALLADAAGTVTFTAAADPPPTAKGGSLLPRTVRGAFQGMLPGGTGLRLIPDDPDEDQRILLGADVTLTCDTGGGPKPVVLADLRIGDQVEAQIGADGRVHAAAASGREVEGIVAALGQTTPWAMPYLRLEGPDETRRVIDLNATVHAPEGDHPVRATPLGALPVGVGDRVRVRYNPASGRIWELWKLPPAAASGR